MRLCISFKDETDISGEEGREGGGLEDLNEMENGEKSFWRIE